MKGTNTPEPNSKKKCANDNVKTMKTSGQIKARAIGPIRDTERAKMILETLKQCKEGTQKNRTGQGDKR